MQEAKAGAFTTRSISRKLITYLLLVSGAVTGVVTLIHLGLDYSEDIGVVEQNFNLIGESHISSLSQALWNLDDSQVRIQLDGILSIPDIRYVELLDPEGKSKSLGKLSDNGAYRLRTFDLIYNNDGKSQHLGKLKIAASLERLYAKMVKKVFVVFFSQLLKTLLVSSLIYMAIRQLLTRHLYRITDFLIKFDLQGQAQELRLQRNESPPDRQDELDTLVRAINKMRAKLSRSYDEIKGFNRELEGRVEENTKIVLAQRQKLEYSAKMTALGEMAGGIAHEINNPLAIIQMRGMQMKEVLSDKEIDLPLLLDLAEPMIQTTERIAKIVRGLRSFARDSANDPPQRVSVRSVLQDSLVLCQERLKTKEIRLEMTEVSESLAILCNPVQLSQVLLNLIGNAIDALEEAPDKWIRISASEECGSVEIRVTDSGSGIPEEIREKIMQPFFTTKGIGKGTGLGLSISQGIIQNQGGKLWIDAAVKNTCFAIRLPLATNEPAQDLPKAA